MTLAQYQILAYRPYAFSREWVAVGVLVYAQQERRLQFVRAPRYDRVRAMFPSADVDELREVFIPLISRQARLSNFGSGSGELDFAGNAPELSRISTELVPDNNNALGWEEPQKMRGPSFEWVENYLTDRLYAAHKPSSGGGPSDDEVWRQDFKPALQGVVKRYERDYTISYNERVFNFDYAKQNGKLHLIDPASFALAQKGSITRKLDRRYGKYAQLARAFPDQEYAVYVPARLPDRGSERGLIVDTLERQLGTDNLLVSVYDSDSVGLLKEQLTTAL